MAEQKRNIALIPVEMVSNPYNIDQLHRTTVQCVDVKAVVSSVMQLSTFTKVTSIPSERNYTNFPVTIRVKAPEMTVHQHAPVDVVAVIDVSGSMGWDDIFCLVPNDRLVLVQTAMAKVIKNLAGEKNRLAVVAFDDTIQASTELLAMTDGGQQSLSEKVNSLKPCGGTNFTIGVQMATKILNNREATEMNRLAFIIFLSDGADESFKTENVQKTYPIHAFGFSANHDTSKLQAMADITSGTYTAINKDPEKITEKLDQLSDKLTSIVAVDMHINLKPIHPGVSLSKIESSTNDDTTGDSYKSQIIGSDKRSGEIFAGAISSGKEREFTVYLDVPEGQGNGVDGSMELLMVGGVYTQSWDQKQVALSESVVSVARPGSSNVDSCKELEWVEERLRYWCKVKQDLSALYDKTEMEAKAKDGGAENKCQVTKALREASLEAINKAMYHDIYIAVLHVLKLRQCRGGSEAAAENAPSAAWRGMDI